MSDDDRLSFNSDDFKEKRLTVKEFLDTLTIKDPEKNKYKKAVIFKKICTCCTFIGTTQKLYTDMINDSLEDQEILNERVLHDIQLECMMKILKDQSFYENACDCCLLKYQCPPEITITNENKYAQTNSVSEIIRGSYVQASETKFTPGPHVECHRKAPSYPSLKGIKQNYSPVKYTISVKPKPKILEPIKGRSVAEPGSKTMNVFVK